MFGRFSFTKTQTCLPKPLPLSGVVAQPPLFLLLELRIIPNRLNRLCFGGVFLCRQLFRMVFYVGDQIVVDILVSGVETALIDDFAAGAKTNQLGGRFTTRIVIVEESMNRRMACEKRKRFRKIDDRV